LATIAAQTGVSTATVRVALGRVPAAEPSIDPEPVSDPGDALDGDQAEPADGAEAAEGADLVVLARPVPRTAERVAALSGSWSRHRW
jgi:predicted dinucleotide-binding enzyme